MNLCVRVFYRLMASFRRRGGKRVAELTGYRLGSANNDITILYEQGIGDGPGEVEVLEEDSMRVRVQVCYESFKGGLRLLPAIPHEVVVTLGAPLDNRKVLDERGEGIPQK